MEEIIVIEEISKYEISHHISADKLNAYLRINLYDKESEITFEEIMDYLKEQSIIYNIKNKDDILNYVKKREYSKDFIIAQGIAPINGLDAKLVYDVNLSEENNFIEKDDGTIDFQNLNNVINISKDDVICHIIPAKEGKDGIDVFGNTILYKKGKDIYFNNGINTYISEDGMKLKASADGRVKFNKENSKIHIENVYSVENVDNATGNIDFKGSVVINGDVKSGFSVKATNDIKIRGMVQGAFIEAGNDVVITNGMNGAGKGKIYAKGNIVSKYIENATIISDKCIYAEALINSDVTAKESIILRGKNSAILGGTSKANDMIYAKAIGSKTYIETNVIIDLSIYKEQEAKYLKTKILNMNLNKELEVKLKEFRKLEQNAETVAKSLLENQNKNAVQRQLLLKKIKLNNEINILKGQLNENIVIDDLTKHKIICRGVMYTNTKITIGWSKYIVRSDLSYSKIFLDGNHISIVTLNPSDLE